MKTYRTIKKVLKYHIEKNVLSLWTWQKGSEEEFCIGCGRTREEIKLWSRETDEWKQKVIDRLRVT